MYFFHLTNKTQNKQLMRFLDVDSGDRDPSMELFKLSTMCMQHVKRLFHPFWLPLSMPLAHPTRGFFSAFTSNRIDKRSTDGDYPRVAWNICFSVVYISPCVCFSVVYFSPCICPSEMYVSPCVCFPVVDVSPCVCPSVMYVSPCVCFSVVDVSPSVCPSVMYVSPCVCSSVVDVSPCGCPSVMYVSPCVCPSVLMILHVHVRPCIEKE